MDLGIEPEQLCFDVFLMHTTAYLMTWDNGPILDGLPNSHSLQNITSIIHNSLRILSLCFFLSFFSICDTLLIILYLDIF